jgi:hypothetical protein
MAAQGDGDVDAARVPRLGDELLAIAIATEESRPEHWRAVTNDLPPGWAAASKATSADLDFVL